MRFDLLALALVGALLTAAYELHGWARMLLLSLDDAPEI